MIVSLLGQQSHKNTTVLPRKTTVLSMIGHTVIDLRYADMSPGVNTIHCGGLFGGVRVIVAPGTQVEVSGIGFLGGFKDKRKAKRRASSFAFDPPIVRVTGLSVLGSVVVEEKSL
jgi:predicted membrane protein